MSTVGRLPMKVVAYIFVRLRRADSERKELDRVLEFDVQARGYCVTLLCHQTKSRCDKPWRPSWHGLCSLSVGEL